MLIGTVMRTTFNRRSIHIFTYLVILDASGLWRELLWFCLFAPDRRNTKRALTKKTRILKAGMGKTCT